MKFALAFAFSVALVVLASPISSRGLSSDVAHCLEGPSCTQLNNIWKFCSQYTGADAEVNTGNCLCNDTEVRFTTAFHGCLSSVEDIQRGDWAGIGEKASSLYDYYCNTAPFNIKSFEAVVLDLSLTSGFPFIIPAGTPFSLIAELKAREYSENIATAEQTSTATTDCESTSSTATAGVVVTSMSPKSSATSTSSISTPKSSNSESSSSTTCEEVTSATSTAGGIETSLNSKSTVLTTKSSASSISIPTIPSSTTEHEESTTTASTAGGVATSVNSQPSSVSLASITIKSSSKIQSSSAASAILTSSLQTSSIATTAAPSCNEDNCLRAFETENGREFCSSFTATSLYNAALPTYATQCTGSSLARISSACTCLNLKSSSSSPTTTIDLTTFLTATFTVGGEITTLSSKLTNSTASENCTTTSAHPSISTHGGFATTLFSNSSVPSIKTVTPTFTSTNIVTVVSVPGFSGYQTTFSRSTATAEGVEVTLSSRTLSTLDVNVDVTTTTLETISATPTTLIVGTSIVVLTSSLEAGNFESTVTAAPTTVVIASTVVVISSLGSAPTSTVPLPESIVEGSSPSIIISIVTALPDVLSSPSIVIETSMGPTLPVQPTGSQTSSAGTAIALTSFPAATSTTIPTTFASTETISVPTSESSALVSETLSQAAASSSTAAQTPTSSQAPNEATSGSAPASGSSLSASGLLPASASQSSAPAQTSGSTGTLIALTGSATNIVPESGTPLPQSESAALSGTLIASANAETLTVIPQSASTAIGAATSTGSSPSSAGGAPGGGLSTKLTSIVGISAASSSSNTQLSSATTQSVELNLGYSVSRATTTAYAVCPQCIPNTVTVTQALTSTPFTLTPLTAPYYSTESASPSLSCIPGMIGITVAGSAQLPECSPPTQTSIPQSSSAAETSTPPLYVSVPMTSSALSNSSSSAANITIVPASSAPSGALPPVPTTTYSQQATGGANMNNINLAFFVGFLALAILI